MSNNSAPVKKSSSKVKNKTSSSKKRNVAKSTAVRARRPIAKKSTKVTSNTRTEKKPKSVVLESVLVINSASDTRGKYADLLNEQSDEIVIDASSVEMIDTAMLQLLYAFVNDLKARNTKVIWKNPSSELIDRSRLLGLVDKMGISSGAAS